MPRMTAHRTALAAAVTAPLLLWAAGPALAHGAPVDPASRVYACSPEGASTGTAACRAAVAANGGPFTAWDNLRVANVGGRDRQTIPDGRLCSGGLPAYKGLDLARADWPTTRLAPGARMTMRYASTIAHTGTFKLYLTKQGYDPRKPLTWSDLATQPFAQVTDPPLTGGAYRIGATLPADRTGPHVLFTVWQNTSTPDTYYSCSDVVFPAAGRAGASAPAATRGADPAPRTAAPSPSPTARRSASAAPSPASAAPASTAADPDEAAARPRTTPVAATSASSGSGPSAPLLAGGAAAVLVLTGGAALAMRLRRR
ncbi:lytic polysaccharide monooxygenase auxiliary activity family 9 protein [Streptomyces doudnae]|uniref:Lytic polysaccharide monooxygenase n=2 Tax=Streptomyces TaxID=1883 RepID=A0ABD5EUP2_9ACTN|nr:lytic polysaccharide monooxygenase [Streptomyces sp. DSM 41981]MDT0438451.1 lytic polysaccharide monooxygenase [Streptomyces sp. DSM 41981]